MGISRYILTLRVSPDVRTELTVQRNQEVHISGDRALLAPPQWSECANALLLSAPPFCSTERSFACVLLKSHWMHNRCYTDQCLGALEIDALVDQLPFQWPTLTRGFGFQSQGPEVL